MSPEAVRVMDKNGPQSEHPMANDWWAFGTLIYEMVCVPHSSLCPSLVSLTQN